MHSLVVQIKRGKSRQLERARDEHERGRPAKRPINIRAEERRLPQQYPSEAFTQSFHKIFAMYFLGGSLDCRKVKAPGISVHCD
jgi:hypothetical protein